MKLFLDGQISESTHSKLGGRVALAFKDLTRMKALSQKGTASERRTAARLRQVLLATLAKETDDETQTSGDIKKMLQELGFDATKERSRREFRQAKPRRDKLLEEQTRKVRSDSKLNIPELVTTLELFWEAKSQSSPVGKHQGRHRKGAPRLSKAEKAEMEKEGRTDPNVRDLLLVTFGAGDVWAAAKEDEELQEKLKEIGRRHKNPRLSRGEGVGLSMIERCRPWYCVTLDLTDIENCIDRYEVEFTQLYKTVKTVRSLQHHGTTKCQCTCEHCRPPGAGGKVPACCQLKPLPDWKEFLRNAFCKEVKVTVAEGVSGKFAPLNCIRNCGDCMKCGGLKLLREKYPLCLKSELHGQNEREFLGYHQVRPRALKSF
jgi:hypothetical protein